jgi:hypothetical protein
MTVACWLNIGYRTNKHGAWGLFEDPLVTDTAEYRAWAAKAAAYPQAPLPPAEDPRDVQIRDLTGRVDELGRKLEQLQGMNSDLTARALRWTEQRGQIVQLATVLAQKAGEA